SLETQFMEALDGALEAAFFEQRDAARSTRSRKQLHRQMQWRIRRTARQRLMAEQRAAARIDNGLEQRFDPAVGDDLFQFVCFTRSHLARFLPKPMKPNKPAPRNHTAAGSGTGAVSAGVMSRRRTTMSW